MCLKHMQSDEDFSEMNRPRRKAWGWLPKMFIHHEGDIIFTGGDEIKLVCSASLPLHEVAQIVDKHLNNHGLMSGADIVAAATRLEQKAGVYFLIADGEVVYVGKSTNIRSRLVNHSFLKSGQFDSYFIIEAPAKDLSDLEGRYIAALKPKLNIVYNN